MTAASVIADSISVGHLGEDPFVEQAVHLAGRRHLAVDARGDVDREAPVGMAQLVEPSPGREIHHGIHRHGHMHLKIVIEGEAVQVKAYAGMTYLPVGAAPAGEG